MKRIIMFALLFTCMSGYSYAATSPGRSGPEAKSAIPDLTNALNDPDTGVRRATVKALGEIGPEAKSAVPELIKLLNDDSLGVRMLTVAALGSIGPEAKSAVPALRWALTEDHHQVRLAAILTLGLIGPEAKSAVPELTRIKDGDTNSVVGRAAAEALDRINNTAFPAGAKSATGRSMWSLYRVPVIILGI